MDYLIRGTAANGLVRAFALESTEMVETARQYHQTSPLVTAALGRLLIAGSIMGADLKSEQDLITLTIRGNGPIEGLTVTADPNGRVKGYAFVNDVELPLNALGKFDVAEGLGIGVLSVIKDIGLKEPYVGQTHLVSSEIGDDIAYYYMTSEQIPSVVALAVVIDTDLSVKKAGGFIIQLMPGASEETIIEIENKIKSIDSLSQLYEQGHTPESLMSLILGDLDFQVLAKNETGYYCNCTRERVEKALVSLGKKELAIMIEEEEKVEVDCHYCDKMYYFDKEQLTQLLMDSMTTQKH